MSLSPCLPSAAVPARPHPDSIEARVEATLACLSPEEKVAQLHGVWFTDLLVDGRLCPQACERRIPHGVGYVSQFASSCGLPPQELASQVQALQQWLRQRTRAGLPAIFHEEVISGLSARGATTFPQQIGMSCTWDADLIRGNAEAIAGSMRQVGCYQALSPMLDVLDDARWGRSEEGFGEDPGMVATFGTAFIQGLQHGGVLATAKHFLGYGGRSDDVVWRWEDCLLPHDLAVQAGVASIMPGYHALDGIPCSSHAPLLTGILRTAWGFQGTVISDYGAIPQVATAYRAAANIPAAGRAALTAGMDVELPCQEAFVGFQDDPGLAADLDRAVRRVLRHKLSLPEDVPGPVPVDLDPLGHRQRALQSAQASLVLLRNEGILPLRSSIRRIAVLGPNADSVYSLVGDYSYHAMSEFWHRRPMERTAPTMWTLLEGLTARWGGRVSITYERGCTWDGAASRQSSGTADIGDQRAVHASKQPLIPHPPVDEERALRLAVQAEVVIAAMGENRYLCGETCDRAEVHLPGEQERFLQRVLDLGRPVILIVFGGRPMILTPFAERCQAIIYAWYPGQAGGLALADVLDGTVSPAGRLTMTLPRHAGQIPTSHRRGYDPADPPLYPFGHGLTYGTIVYGSLVAPVTVACHDDGFDLSWTLTNTGDRTVVEVAQVYGRRGSGLVLLGFVRISLAPGIPQRVTLRVHLEQLARFTPSAGYRIGPSTLDVQVGRSSLDAALVATMTLMGPSRDLVRRTHALGTASG